jgi:hypothetical protein
LPGEWPTPDSASSWGVGEANIDSFAPVLAGTPPRGTETLASQLDSDHLLACLRGTLGEISVRQRNPADGSWSNAGFPVGHNGYAVEVSKDSDGNGYVAWRDDGIPTQVRLMTYDDVAWTELGGSAQSQGVSASAAGASEPAVAIGPAYAVDQIVCVAWVEAGPAYDSIFVRCHDAP